ncbi:hydroxymyristoyl-ACP dehydratase [Treponema bryantii]|uniref:ApeI family dehydratase n=1 Tax=Treponema bryantii TaxID=163 RepID=UPI002B2C0794|nr:3-hydroxyacyl-[acyl-carrier-protein] dehydratase FabZ [Treponema bryantii]
MNFNDHDIKDEVVVSKEENSVALEFVIPASSDFFDGHFPQYKLLPAVAQFEVITRFSRKYFGTQRYVPNIKRMKFSAPIKPDTKIHLELTYKKDKGTVTFNMADANVEGKVYSSGSFAALSEISA